MVGEKMIEAHVVENGASDYAVDVTVSGYHLTGDESRELGGANLGPSPYDLLLAALGECTSMTVRWFAKQHGWPLEKVEVRLTHYKGDSAEGRGKTDYFTKEIHLHGDQLTEDQRTKLMQVAAKCPVQRTLEGTPVIKTS